MRRNLMPDEIIDAVAGTDTLTAAAKRLGVTVAAVRYHIQKEPIRRGIEQAKAARLVSDKSTSEQKKRSKVKAQEQPKERALTGRYIIDANGWTVSEGIAGPCCRRFY